MSIVYTSVYTVCVNRGVNCKSKVQPARAEMKTYKKIPVIAEFVDKDGNNILQQSIDSNYHRVKQEIIALVESETERIKADPELSKLLNKKE